MKVVLFCGGFGLRLREYSDAVPKPLVPIGPRPIIWHLMKYYAHYGHKDFILCLGWNAVAFKEYFLKYDECVSNDFVLRGGGDVKLLASDIHDWTITFVDTGAASNVGQRLKAVEPFLESEERFLVNYSDGLADLRLPELIEFHQARRATATFMVVKPLESYHTVRLRDDGGLDKIGSLGETDVWINAGFFVMERAIFNYLDGQEDLLQKPLARLMAERKVYCHRHRGFFACMDTYKEKQQLDDMYARGDMPWAVWDADRLPSDGSDERTFAAIGGQVRN